MHYALKKLATKNLNDTNEAKPSIRILVTRYSLLKSIYNDFI